MNDDYDDYAPPVTQFMAITENKEKSRVEVSIRGVFPDVTLVAVQLERLEQLSKTYQCIKFNINSPGGYLTTFLDLWNVSKNFTTVITAASGEICSAGFFLWCAGTIRVISPYTMIMAHRETYGHWAKTAEILHKAQYMDAMYAEMLDELCEGILTDDEIEKAKLTEVYLSPKEMVERGVAISLDQFLERDSMTFYTMPVVSDGEKIYLFGENGIATEVELTYTGEAILIKDLVYDLPNKLDSSQLMEIIKSLSEETGCQIEVVEEEPPKKTRKPRTTKRKTSTKTTKK